MTPRFENIRRGLAGLTGRSAALFAVAAVTSLAFGPAGLAVATGPWAGPAPRLALIRAAAREDDHRVGAPTRPRVSSAPVTGPAPHDHEVGTGVAIGSSRLQPQACSAAGRGRPSQIAAPQARDHSRACRGGLRRSSAACARGVVGGHFACSVARRRALARPIAARISRSAGTAAGGLLQVRPPTTGPAAWSPRSTRRSCEPLPSSIRSASRAREGRCHGGNRDCRRRRCESRDGAHTATRLGAHDAIPGIVVGGLVLAAVTSLPVAVAAAYDAPRQRSGGSQHGAQQRTRSTLWPDSSRRRAAGAGIAGRVETPSRLPMR